MSLPGRLGDPSRELYTDPRTDPRLVAAMAPFGLDRAGDPPPVTPADPLEARLEFAAGAEAGFEAVFAALAGETPTAGIVKSTETITGAGGHEITLYVSRPEAEGTVPGVLHIHGGGMALLHAGNPLYARWRDDLAALGVVVVGVEFRNSAGAFGPHPYPAGLDDCMAALEWMDENRAALGISGIVVNGESGGGNLTLATALRARREGVLHRIQGVYGMMPYVSGRYGHEAEFPSQTENDTYFISCAILDVLASVYGPDDAHWQDPLAWPLYAEAADLEGLPPHVISVDELDPLRDEGLAYLRKLQHAGVEAAGHIVSGVCHGGELIAMATMPDVYAKALADIHRFAVTVSG